MNINLTNSIQTSDDFFESSYDSLDTSDTFDDRARILIVDDEEAVRDLIAYCLSDKYACFKAESTETALLMLAEMRFSLVISDWVMPGLSGTTLLRKVVADYPETPVIMLTGVDFSERILDAIRLGAFDYLIKPCDLNILELTVERALKHR